MAELQCVQMREAWLQKPVQVQGVGAFMCMLGSKRSTAQL